MTTDLSAFLERVRPAIDATLNELLPPENHPPERIHQAMRYSTMNGGKRIRPALCIAAFTSYSPEWTPVLPVAAAIEMVHAYSLIHDDLPAMDDDDYRRGRLSCHKQFNEAIAILAGDALLTLAFEVLSKARDFAPERLLRAVSVLGAAGGSSGGMVAGQVLDLENEGREVTRERVEAIHRSKTGALLGASVWIGSFLGGMPEGELTSVRTFCDRVGLAFQVIDDILDATEDSNRDAGKATFPALYGISGSRLVAEQLMHEARQALEPLGRRAELLLSFCDYLERRTN
jgi:geranylgeranyl diphosphate synthase type II